MNNSNLLRFITAGSVDDGKSTLIGRLLYDSKTIYQDQYEAIQKVSIRRGESSVNLALLTDGLKSEREQGITIDVAYRYFSTPKRKFIIADSPGHIQYTRNMVTGASTSNVILIVIDARNGVVEQTKRHTVIASLLQIPHIVVCINKMDLVDYNENVYNKIKTEFANFTRKLNVTDVEFIPMSATSGDNIVSRSQNMNWYQGSTLMYYLENVHIASDNNLIDVRFPVQYVIRPNNDEYHDYRAYAGRVAGGILKLGDEVLLLPSGFVTHIREIQSPNGLLQEAFPPQSVSIILGDNFDLSRGDMIVRKNNQPDSTQDLVVMLCWFDQETSLKEKGKYIVKHTTQEVRCIIKDIQYKLDINTLHRQKEDKLIKMNDIAKINLKTTKPLFIDNYLRNKITGSIILIDEATKNTVAAGMII